MKKYTIVFTILLFILSLTACSVNRGISMLPSDMNTTDSKILIAYFTWADNTQVADPDSVDVDASTSASVLVPGNAAIVADYIHDAVGGDLFSIVVTEPYSDIYNECLQRAKEEKDSNARPSLATEVDNMSQYDIIFLGYPNWWYTVPMAIHSFLEAYDFSDKIIIPFCAHGTGKLASSVKDIAASLDDDVTLINNAFGVYRSDTVGCRPLVNDWLQSLGFEVAT